MWGDMAREFNRELVETMEGPVITDVSSCRVPRYKGCQVHVFSDTRHVSRSRDWYYILCGECTRKVQDDNGVWKCVDHGPQPDPTYRYSFKAFVSDDTTTTVFTFFTPSADAITGHESPEFVRKLDTPNPQQVPPEVLAIEGRGIRSEIRSFAKMLLHGDSSILTSTPQLLELANLEDAEKIVVRGETRIISAKRLVLQNSAPEVKKKKG
ncbi:nucleic acid-binding, OB-fold protein [Tanacetum coccineum]